MDPVNIEELPIEMIVEIFRYLNFSDLQSAALTCHRWLEVSKGSQFMRKIVFCPTASRNYSSVMNSQRSFPNVYLKHNTHIIPRKLFEHMGKSAVTATITDSNLSHKDFLAVFTYLHHLRKLKISCDSKIFVDRKFLESPTDQNDIAEVMANIRKLSIQSTPFSGVNFLRLTSFISKLESLDIRESIHNPRFWSSSSDEELSKPDLKFKSIYNIIAIHQATLRVLKLSKTQLDKATLSSLCELKYLKLRTLFVCESLYYVFATGFQAFLQTQSNLRHLDLTNSMFVKDECVETIVDALKSLEILNLKGCLLITNSGMLAIAKLRKLRSLNISAFRSITSEGIINGIASVTNTMLQQLYMSTLNLTEECVKLCVQHLPELRVLDLCYCSDGVTDHSVQAIIRNLKLLRELSLAGCIKITDAALTGTNDGASIQQLKGLRSLDLSKCSQISETPLISSFNFIELQRLNLSGCKKISVMGIQALVQSCLSLEVLDVSGCINIDEKSFEEILSQSKRVKELFLPSGRYWKNVPTGFFHF